MDSLLANRILRIKKGNPQIDIISIWGFFLQNYKIKTGDAMNYKNIKKALLFIDNNFNRPIPLDEISIESGMSKYHFARTFKAVTGNTFKTYHNKKRIEVAKKLLKNDEMSITDVCYSLGFTDASYFNRVFRKHEETTPSLYRNSVIHRKIL